MSRQHSAYEVKCENCGAKFETPTPECKCPRRGVLIVIDGWGKQP